MGSPAFDEYDAYSDTLEYCTQFELSLPTVFR